MRVVSWWLMLAVAVLSCSRAPEQAAPDSAMHASADSTAVDSSAAPSRSGAVSSIALTRAPPVAVSLGPYSFRHEKHRSLQCQRCHAAVPGHTVHTNVACTSCHAPVPATGPPPKADECAACHHANTQGRPCMSCHAATTTRAPLTLDLQWKLSVWPTPRQRSVTFEHGWHTSLQCTDCHINQPQLVPTKACGSCHVHHEGQANCRTCHQSPPTGVHTNAAHNGCAGSGCHQNLQ